MRDKLQTIVLLDLGNFISQRKNYIVPWYSQLKNCCSSQNTKLRKTHKEREQKCMSSSRRK